jgi:FtsP/CotA-like multicopper oxidase with cupredoxin domain
MMMDMSKVARVRLGDVERWNVLNSGGDGTHLFHIRDVQFQILNRNSTPPAANELGRKGTRGWVCVPPHTDPSGSTLH